MTRDEKAIRAAIAAWLRASRAGDSTTLAALLADDVRFVVVDRPAFGKKEFFGAGGGKPFRFRSRVKVHEVIVHGDWAVTWLDLALAITPVKDSPEITLAGPTMSVWKKSRAGRWQIWRDANMVRAQDGV